MIPIYLVTGFLGSGKTTLLREIYRHNSGRRLIYLINEFSVRDVDTDVLELSAGQVISVAGGSIFCTCKVSEFVSTLQKILKRNAEGSGQYEGLVIEASGIADPTVIRTLLQDSGLADQFRIERIICVTDSVTLPKLMHTLPNIKKQVSAADRVVLNKIDLVGQDTVETVRKQVITLNNRAELVETTYGSFLQNPLETPSAIKEWPAGRSAHEPPQGFEKFSLQSRKRIHTGRIRELITAHLEDLYRIKGFFHDEEGMIMQLDYSLSGGLRLEPGTGTPKIHLEFIYHPRIREELRHRIRTWSH
jgi:G3E family GTPase